MTGVVRRSARQLGAVGSAISGAVPAVATGRTLSPWGVLVGVLVVVLLYLLLSRSTLTAKAIAGVLSAARWAVSPTPLPF